MKYVKFFAVLLVALAAAGTCACNGADGKLQSGYTQGGYIEEDFSAPQEEDGAFEEPSGEDEPFEEPSGEGVFPEVEFPSEAEPSEEDAEPLEAGGADGPTEEVEIGESEVKPEIKYARYIRVTADGVNIRRRAGTDGRRAGTAERDTLYICYGGENGWYRTAFAGGEAYICAKYCAEVEIPAGDERVERVIEEGCRLLGTKYVYGAVRYLDGNGRRLAGFTETEFDCSSLMQYIFKKGADINLQVNTRTQVYQGVKVQKEEIERGDLLFFTNSSRKDKSGVERVGHVALYLGGGYILHTASDYAKIEKMTAARRAYFIQANRMIVYA